MFNSKYRYPIAIDFTETALCAVQFKETKKHLSIRGMHYQQLETSPEALDEAPETLVPALRAIAKNKDFKGKQVTVHLPPQKVLSFPLRLKIEGTETLEDAIVRETREYLPFPLEEAVIDYPSIMELSSDPEKTYKATVIAARTGDIQHYAQVLKKAGLSLETVDFPVSSLYRLHNYLFENPEKPVILCHIGPEQTLAAAIQNDGIMGERVIPWGINGLVTKIQSQMELKNDRHKARLLLKNFGLSGASRPESAAGSEPAADDAIYQILNQIISPYVETLADELHRLIAYIRSEEVNAHFEGLYLYGRSSLIHSLDAYIEKRLALPTRSVDPTENLPDTNGALLSGSMDKEKFSLSLGLAMRKIKWL
jgi:type IV pilus assembly protein PilM